MKWAIALGLSLAGCAGGEAIVSARPWLDFFNQPRSAEISKDVRAFVIRTQGCGHFSGEEGYDAERAAFLKARIDELCPGIPAARTRLLAKYPGKPEVQAIIAEVAEGYSFS